MYNFDEIIDRSNINAHVYVSGKANNPGVPDDFIPMWAADMAFSCPPPVLDAMKARIDKKIMGYTKIGDPRYPAALHDFMKRRHGWEIDPKLNIVCSGVCEALGSVCIHIPKQGEGVMMLTPTYAPFYYATQMAGKKAVFSPLINENGYYSIDWEDFEAKAREPMNTLLLFCSPHNPTGRVWTKDELRRLGDICFENDVFIVSDEIHFDLIRKGHTHTVLAPLFPKEKRIITCTSPSKTFNLAGNKLANIIFQDEDMWKEWATKRWIGPQMPHPVSVDACIAAYTDCDRWVDEANEYIDSNFTLMKKRIDEELPNVKFTIPEGTYLAWIDMRDAGFSQEEIKTRFVKKGLLIEYAKDFISDGDGYIRINIACPKAILNDAINRMIEALSF